jgi:hypothetical protein
VAPHTGILAREAEQDRPPRPRKALVMATGTSATEIPIACNVMLRADALAVSSPAPFERAPR